MKVVSSCHPYVICNCHVAGVFNSYDAAGLCVVGLRVSYLRLFNKRAGIHEIRYVGHAI
jgi:hypothetical protein